MNRRTLLIFMVLTFFVVSCSSSALQNVSKPAAVIYPIHPEPSDEKYWKSNHEYVYSHIDFDGNQYVTKWELINKGTFDIERFKSARRTCKASTFNLFPVDLLTVPIVEKESLLYNDVVTCFSAKGYVLLGSRAHHPEAVVINLYKSYSSAGESVGAGGVVTISSSKIGLSAILPNAKICYQVVENSYNQGDMGGYIYINMGPVLDAFKECLVEKGFTLLANKT